MGQPTPWPPGNELPGITASKNKDKWKIALEKMAEQEKKNQNLITGWTVDSHQQQLLTPQNI